MQYNNSSSKYKCVLFHVGLTDGLFISHEASSATALVFFNSIGALESILQLIICFHMAVL